MKTQTWLGMLIVSSTLVAQGEANFARPQDPAMKTATPRPDVVSRLMPREQILFDQVDGSLWAAADRYKVEFGRQGTAFIPYLGADAVHDWPATFRLEAVSVAGTRLDLLEQDPQHAAMKVSYDRGALIESYDLRQEGIEQSFRFDTLPVRGELVVTIGVRSDLEVRRDGGGFEFRGPDGSFHYGVAIAIDANGASIPIEERWSGGAIDLVVPANFVQNAALPLIIDPMIGNMFVAHSDTKVIDSVDVGWSPIDSRCTICYERHYSQTDSDVYLLVLNSSMSAVLSSAIIDSTTTSWRKCRIASIISSQCHLIVAEASSANAAPFRIMGRRAVTAGGGVALDSSFEIAASGNPSGHPGDCFNPDVGGDSSYGTGAFTIVWEREYNNLDHDIEMRRVGGDGTFLTPTSYTLENSSLYESLPVISKWNGSVPGLPQKWAVVFQRRSLVTGNGHLRVSIIGKDGLPLFWGLETSTQVTVPTAVTSGGYDVSSPTDDVTGRKFLVAHTEMSANGARTIYAAVFDSTGAIHVGDQEIIQNEYLPLNDVKNPSVDCDGCRFAVAFSRVFNAATDDEDLLIKNFGLVGSNLAPQDSSGIATGSEFEGSPAIIARKGNGSGSGNATVDYALAWTHQLDPNTRTVEVQRYEGHAVGGFAVRPAGCSNVQISHGGSAQLGRNVSFHVSAASGIVGLLAGLPLSIAFPDCSCLLAVNGQAYTGSDFSFSVPCNAALVGGTVSFQGFGVASGTCLGAIGLTDAIDVIIE